jgi:hypothetical protein
MRLCSSIVLARSRSSRAMARFISPIFHRRSEIRGGFISRSWDSRPRKMSKGKYRRFSPQSGHSERIHEAGKVWTDAGMFCRQPLQRMTKGWIPEVGPWNMNTVQENRRRRFKHRLRHFAELSVLVPSKRPIRSRTTLAFGESNRSSSARVPIRHRRVSFCKVSANVDNRNTQA